MWTFLGNGTMDALLARLTPAFEIVREISGIDSETTRRDRSDGETLFNMLENFSREKVGESRECQSTSDTGNI